MARSNTYITDLTEGKTFNTLIRFSLPFMLANLLQTFYTMTDMFIVGRFLGSEGIAAVSVSGSVILLLTNIGMQFSVAGQILISQQVGAKAYDRVKKSIGTLFSMTLILAIIFASASSIGAKTWLTLLNIPEESRAGGISYLTICGIGMLFVYCYDAICAVLKSYGESKLTLVFIIISTVINVVLDYLFVGPLHMGTTGAALATVIGQFVCFATALIYLIIKREKFCFDFKLKSFSIDRKTSAAIMKLGAPLLIHVVSISGSELIVCGFINDYGLAVTTAYSITCKIYNLLNTVLLSIRTAAVSMIGQCLGAGKTERIKPIVYYEWLVNITFTSIIVALVYFFPRQVFGFFDSNPEVLNIAKSCIICVIPAFIGYALLNPPVSLMEGLGDVKRDLIIALADGVVARLLISIVLGHFFGAYGYIFGSGISGWVTVLLGAPYVFMGKWKNKQVVLK